MNQLNSIVRVVNAPAFFWFLLSLPGLVWLFGYWQETLYYGEFIHSSGDLAVQLLIATLAITPLRLLFPKTFWIFWLQKRRRYLGVASFVYGLLHTLVYLQRKTDISIIFTDALDIAIGTGWLALLFMLVLALTSNNLSVRYLKQMWQRLHRLVYPAAILIFAHWVLTAFDPKTAYVHLGVLTGIETIRLLIQLKRADR